MSDYWQEHEHERCLGETIDGPLDTTQPAPRCYRITKHASGFCWQHRDQAATPAAGQRGEE